MITDNEEFYEQHKPLSFQDVKELVIILKETLWDLVWVIPKNDENFVQSVSSQKEFSYKERD